MFANIKITGTLVGEQDGDIIDTRYINVAYVQSLIVNEYKDGITCNIKMADGGTIAWYPTRQELADTLAALDLQNPGCQGERLRDAVADLTATITKEELDKLIDD